MEIVKKLMSHIEKAEGTQYRDELLSKVIEVCSHENYKNITNFEWLAAVDISNSITALFFHGA